MYQLVIRGRWLLLSLLIGTAFALAPGIKSALIPNNTIKTWFSADDPAVVAYNKFLDQFGTDEVALLLVVAKGAQINSHELDQIATFSAQAEKLPGVYRVVSLLNMNILEGNSLASDLYDRWREERHPQLNDMMSDPLYQDLLVSESGKSAPVWIYFDRLDDRQLQRDQLIAHLRQLADQVFENSSHPMGGMGILYSDLNDMTKRDLKKLLTISTIMALGLFWLLFRSFRFVLAAAAILALSVVIMAGAFGTMGHHLDVLTLKLPIFVVVIGISTIGYFPAPFLNALRASRSAKDAAMQGLRLCLIPCAVTVLTAVLGFLSLTTTPVEVLQNFGLFGAIGIATIFPAAACIMPICFLSFPDHEIGKRNNVTTKAVAFLLNLLSSYPRRLGIISVAVILMAAAGLPFLKIDTHFISYLPKDATAVVDQALIEKAYGPYVPLELTVSIADFARDVVLADSFLKAAEQLPEVKKAVGFPTLYKWVNQEINKGQAVFERKAISEVNGIIESEKSQNPFSALLKKDLSQGRLTLLVDLMTAKGYRDLLRRIENLSTVIFGRSDVVKPQGLLSLYAQSTEYITRSQERSLFTGLATILLLTIGWLRSVQLAFAAFISSLFTLLIIFAVIGYAHVPFDIPVVLLIGIVLGLSSDNSIHFLHHWRQAEAAEYDWSRRLKYVFDHTADGTVITSVILFISFPVFLAAESGPLRAFGYLMPIGVAAGLFGGLIILPLAMRSRGGPWRQAK